MCNFVSQKTVVSILNNCNLNDNGRICSQKHVTKEYQLTICSSTGAEDSLRFSLYTVAEDPLEKSKSTVASDWSLQSPFEQNNAKSISSSGMSFGGSCHLTCTERLLSGRASPPESSDAGM